MTFTQETFLGASIRSFTGHVGWGSSPSQVTVEVCEDDVRNEHFTPPLPGSLVYFVYQSWSFGGFLQSHKKLRGQDGNSLYSCVLEDPRELLTGVQLIINDYISTTYSVPNLYNIYGYLESTVGFGAANVNSAGMPWQTIKDTFLTLQATTPIRIYDQTLKIDLTNLPNPSSYHRISGTNISLMDFINDICQSAGSDYFFRLISVNGENILVLYTISRNSNSDPDAVANFINSLDGFNRSEMGLEFRNEVNNKFLVGGKVQKLYAQTSYFNTDTSDLEVNNKDYPYYALDTIYPYFGNKENNEGVKLAVPHVRIEFDEFGDLPREFLIGYYTYASNDGWTTAELSDGNILNYYEHTQIGFYHPVVIDNIKIKLHPWITAEQVYITDYRELRAALTSQDAWMNFLFMHDRPAFKYLFEGDKGFKIPNIHQQKFGKNGFDLISAFSPQFLDTIDAKLAGANGDDALLAWVDAELTLSTVMKNKVTLENVNDPQAQVNKLIDHEENIKSIYDVIRRFAEEYFGRKYMVSVDFVSGKINRDEDAQISDWRGDIYTLPGNKITTSWEPAQDGGYLDNVDYQITEGNNGSEYNAVPQGEFAKAIQQTLLPLDIKKLIADDGKILAYAIYDKVGPGNVVYDFSEIQESEKTEFNGYVYIKCEIDPQLVFLDNSNLFSPRAVITLPGIVSIAKFKYTWQAEMLKSVIRSKAVENNMPEAKRDILDEKLNAKLGFGNVGQDFMNEDYFPFPVSPSRVVVPLKSNINTYGPWYSIGANGKTEFEADESLVPWNYGSYNDMNLAAQARVQTGATTQQYGSNGSITFDGVPEIQLGDLLTDGGPYLTDIQVDISENGALTTYTCNTWTKQFGVMAKEMLDENRKNKQLLMKQRKAAFHASKLNLAGKQNNKQKGNAPKKFKSFSTHPVLISDKVGEKHTIVSSPGYNMVDQTLVPSGKNVAALDTIFVPFSTNINERSQPHFEAPSGNISVPNATGLNPFVGPHNFTLMTRASHESEDDLNILNSGIDDTDGYRGFALRSPLVLAGWGYDKNGKPVPNKTPSSPGDEFAAGYKQNPNLWKAGPLDCRWDDSNKMWIANGGSQVSRGYLLTDLYFNNSGLCDIYQYVNESGKNIRQSSDFVFDWILASGYHIPKHTKCIIFNDGNRKYVINASVYSEGYLVNTINY